jgi:hypothetical protein
MNAITRQQFHCPDMPMACSPHATEMAWFAHAAMLGAVLLDSVDKDWSFVAMGPDEEDRYRCFDLGVNLPTAEAARTALKDVFVANEARTVFPQAEH